MSSVGSQPDAPVVVMGDDGSPAADLAWTWLNHHRWTGWRLDVLTATEPERPVLPADHREPVEWTPTWEREVATDAGFALVRFLHGEGDPRVVLGERAGVDLLVVGAKDRSHLRALWVGSTTEWLLHHPPNPLAVIRSSAAMNNVVVCTDGSPHAQRAIEAFARLPSAKDANVTVVSVDDGHVDPAAAVSAARAVLDQGDVAVSVESLEGKPRAVIPEYLSEHHPDLVVLGTRGLTGWRRLRFGSTAAAVVHTTHSSALFACADETP